MPIVFEDLDYPGGTVPQSEVQITLAGAGCQPLSGVTSPDIRIIGSKRLTMGAGIDETGYWEIDLVGNDAISPTGTGYRVTRRTRDGAVHASCISVPVSGGPFGVSTLEIVAPEAVPDSGVTQNFLTARERELDEEALARKALSRYRADVARTRSGTAGDLDARSTTIAFLGDSFTESYEPTKRGFMWTNHLSRRLNGASLRGSQYLPAGCNLGASTTAADWPGDQAPWTYSSAPAGDTFHGASLHAVTMVSGSTATITFSGTYITVLFTRTPGGPAAAAVTLDGVAQTAISAQGAELAGQQAVYIADGYGSHTLVITSTSGQLMLEGAYVHDEVSVFGIPCRGIRSLAFGHTGFSSQFFVDRRNWEPSLINALSSSAVGAHISLFGLGLGANDVVFGTAPGVFQQNLLTVMERVDAGIDATGITVDPGFLLLAFPTVTQQLVDAMWGARDIYGTDRVGVLDLRKRIPGSGAGAGAWGIFDAGNGHPNDAGQKWLAEVIADFIDSGSNVDWPQPSPGYSQDDIVIEAATPADFRSNWTEGLAFFSVTSGHQYDLAAGASDVKERRHRVALERGTYEVLLRYGQITTTGGQAQVQVGGTTIGSVTTTGTTNNIAETNLGSIVIDSPGPQPVIIRKTALNAGPLRFVRLLLRKTA